jgi:SAM-dependent methyltransferase
MRVEPLERTEPWRGRADVSDLPPDPVRDFYTHHPYPPPVENLDRARDDWRDESRHRAEYHLVWPHQPYRADLDILIAGCGTWQAAKYAICRPGARLVGIDISTTSLEHTARLKRQYSLTNLELGLLPIERAAELQRPFDLIVCTGVLHHLADPDAGLRALRSVLKPEGAMHVMVYAPYGRTGVDMLKDYCRRLGIGTSDHEIHDLLSVLAALPRQHPLAALLRGARDSEDPAAIADALLNPRDRAYSVPQLFEFLEHNGLTLSRWHSQAPYLPQCGAIAATPHGTRLARLPARQQYAAMELWRGVLATHSVIVSRSDVTESGAHIGFDDDRVWTQYVPIRFPGAVCVEEGLPEGASGALLSRYHSSSDLVLAIDREEKQIVDAIDSRRSISEIIGRAASPRTLPKARSLFEKLFWYDQVVFDASKVG